MARARRGSLWLDIMYRGILVYLLNSMKEIKAVLASSLSKL